MSLPTLPALVVGHVSHTRRTPFRRAFRYGVYQWLVDLDRIPEQPWYLRPFATFAAADHLGDPASTLKANVGRYLATHGIRLGEGSRVLMLANARVLGYIFDPLTVFWCFAAEGALACVLAEVHNTYGERHVYLLRQDQDGGEQNPSAQDPSAQDPSAQDPSAQPVSRFHARKELYVSPFHDVSGDYALRFGLSDESVSSTVALVRDGSTAFTATFHGVPRPATRRAILAQLLRKPLMPQRVSALIRMHGAVLWLRRLPVIPRPDHPRQEGV